MTYREHVFQLCNHHRLSFFFATALALLLLALGYFQESLWKAFTYIGTIGCGFLISEFIFFSQKFDFPSWKINQPKKELRIIFFAEVIVVILLIYWFIILKEEPGQQIVMVILFALRILFVFPVFFLVYFLFFKNYTFKSIGFRMKYWYIVIPIIAFYGGVTYLIFPGDMQFVSMLDKHDPLSILTLGILTAAIPEELTRNLLQSRLSFVTESNSFGWIVASVIWAVIHIPSFSREEQYMQSILSALGILPLGLFWGYLNQRYKSIIPSILFHGTNLWGLHNLF